MRYFEALRQFEFLDRSEINVDEETRIKVQEFFNLLNQNIKPTMKYKDKYWTFYFAEDKGTLDEFESFLEKHYSYEDDNDKEYETEVFNSYSEKEWIQIKAIEIDNDYKVINFDNRYGFVIAPKNNKNGYYNYDLVNLLEWVIEKTKEVIKELDENTYNLKIKKELPDDFKVGTLKRSNLWKLHPASKNNYLELISEDRIEEFVNYFKKDLIDPTFRLKSMTINKYLEYCSYCYRTNKMEGYETMSNYELFCRHSCSHGIGDGMEGLDWDSESDYDRWMELLKDDNNRFEYDWGGHKWAIVDGSSRSRINFAPEKDNDGYYFSLYGGEKYSTVEVANTFIELVRNNIPVKLYDHQIMTRKLTGNDLIGIVPRGVLPVYCGEYFREDHVVSFCNLYEIEDIPKIKNYITWHKISKLERL